MKKYFAILLFCFISNNMMAEIASGTYGDNITWSLSDDYTLTLSGSGDMPLYTGTYAPWYDYRVDILQVSISDQITSIGELAFYMCSGLTSVTIPSSVTAIGHSAFNQCYRLSSITIPNSVTTIGDAAFYGCTHLTSITIPNSVTTIEYNAFDGCQGLTSITLPDSLTTIKSGTFFNCTALSAITIPDNVTTIEDRAFKGCSELTSVIIPDNVTTIGASVFSGCNGLSSVTIGKSITAIEEWAFQGCKKLEKVYCYAESVPAAHAHAFENSNIENCTLYVPASALQSYGNRAPWKNFGTIFDLEGNDIKTINGLTESERVEFYTADGKLVNKTNAFSDAVACLLQKGIMIVKKGNQSIKVLVK